MSINDLDDGTDLRQPKTVRGVADIPEGCAVTCVVLNMLEIWVMGILLNLPAYPTCTLIIVPSIRSHAGCLKLKLLQTIGHLGNTWPLACKKWKKHKQYFREVPNEESRRFCRESSAPVSVSLPQEFLMWPPLQSYCSQGSYWVF